MDSGAKKQLLAFLNHFLVANGTHCMTDDVVAFIELIERTYQDGYDDGYDERDAEIEDEQEHLAERMTNYDNAVKAYEATCKREGIVFEMPSAIDSEDSGKRIVLRSRHGVLAVYSNGKVRVPGYNGK
jgi:hypothetical protein